LLQHKIFYNNVLTQPIKSVQCMIDAMQHKPTEGVAAEASPFDYLI